MLPRNSLRFAAAAVALLNLTVSAHPLGSADTMADTANRFLASLTPDQVSKATFAFDNEERFNWHFIPRERKGLPLKEMTSAQKHLAGALLSAGLSTQGYIKASSIMSLEDVLRIIEKDDGVRRNPEGYFFTIFGKPSPTGTWAYRVEGHHLALNFTVANGKVTGAPNFMGSNPAEVREGPRKGLRILHAEEDLARALLKSLTPEQKKVAIVSKDAYKDIITMASRKASLEGHPSGLQAAKMTEKQRSMLEDVIDEYANNLPAEIAQDRIGRAKKAGTNLYFAWAGGEDRGDPHYYRIQGPDFLIEYDNTQNNANHIHSVWRDMTGDFGADLLKEHYAASHSKTGASGR